MNRSALRLVAVGAPLALASMASAQMLAAQGSPFKNSPYNGGFGDMVNYSHDDGTVENGIGITGTNPFDIIWLNRFTVVAGGETITHVQGAIGSPADTRVYDGLAMTVLVYEDVDGGSPTNATLLTSHNTVVANGNTGLLNNYDIPDTAITTSEFWIAIVMKNLPGGNGFVASIDQDGPADPGVSYAGFTIPGGTLNEANLATIPVGQLGTIEGFGLPGNWVLRATGIPAPASVGLFAIAGLIAGRRRRA